MEEDIKQIKKEVSLLGYAAGIIIALLLFILFK